MLVRPEDHTAVAAVHTRAFGQPNEAVLVERLRSSDAFVPSLSLVAEDDGEIVAPSKTCDGD